MTNKRAYSLLEIKAATDEDGERTITGLATSPEADRHGDIVDPEGATYKLPIPFLWQHDPESPIGEITSAKVTAKGIEITAKLASIAEPGAAKDLVDKAWQFIKSGLVKGLSIGFRSIDAEQIDNSWGLRFKKWEWLELSAVTIPANGLATISSIKSYDRASSGNSVVRLDPPGVTGKTPAKSHKPQEGNTVNLSESITAFEAKRAALVGRQTAIMAKANEEGRTLDDAEGEEHDNIAAELVSVDKHLSRLRTSEKASVSTARTVEGGNAAEAGASRGAEPTIRVDEKLEKGIRMARYVMCLGAAKGELGAASQIAQSRFPNDPGLNHVLKAAVAAGTTTDATWARPLVEYNDFSGDFLDFLRPQTILGQFGQNGRPDLRRIPFNVHIKGQTSGGTAYWVGEGKPKPVTKFDFNDVYMGFTKVAAIAVLTEELMRFSNPAAEGLVRNALAGAVIEQLDRSFIDPASAAITGVRPASITNGVTPIASSGPTAENMREDISALWAQADATNLPAGSAVYITDSRTVRRAAMLRNGLGQREFPDLTMTGGTIDGVPVIVSNYVDADTAGSLFILAFASEIWLADDNLVTIDASREASLQMLDNPTNDATNGTATSMVSMFQTNSVALRAEREINWQKRRPQAVAYLTGVNWGA